VGLGDDREAYCEILDSIPSKSGLSPGKTSGLELILQSPLPVLSLLASTKPSPAPEAKVAGQGIPVEAGAHVVVPDGSLCLFS
jgi:hypothetical protein